MLASFGGFNFPLISLVVAASIMDSQFEEMSTHNFRNYTKNKRPWTSAKPAFINCPSWITFNFQNETPDIGYLC